MDGGVRVKKRDTPRAYRSPSLPLVTRTPQHTRITSPDSPKLTPQPPRARERGRRGEGRKMVNGWRGESEEERHTPCLSLPLPATSHAHAAAHSHHVPRLTQAHTATTASKREGSARRRKKDGEWMEG